MEDGHHRRHRHLQQAPRANQGRAYGETSRQTSPLPTHPRETRLEVCHQQRHYGKSLSETLVGSSPSNHEQ